MQAFVSMFLRHNKYTILASFVLAMLFIGMAKLIEYRGDQQLRNQLKIEAQGFKNGFELSQQDVEQQMLLVARLLAENTRVQTLFYQGSIAQQSEGGGAGDTETAFWRSALLQYLAPRWQLMQDEYGLRQLQFHLPTDVTSFLRVHNPSSYGDSLKGVRKVIEDVLQDQQARSGFETGRIYSGIRGVVPVWFTPPFQSKQFIGVLEAGISLDQQLMRLDQQYDAGFALLLRQEHVDERVWQDYRDLNGVQLPADCNCYIESSSRDTIIDWLKDNPFSENHNNKLQSTLSTLFDQSYHLIRFPLFEYQGPSESNIPVGSVWIWQDKTELVRSVHQNTLQTRLLLLLTYLISLVLVIWLLSQTRLRLQNRIDQALSLQARTEEKLKASERRYQNAFSAVNDGLWEVNFVTGELHWDRRCFEMLGYQEEKPLKVDDWYAHIHPDDLHQVQLQVQKHFENHQPYRVEYRSLCADGSWLWVEGRGKVTEWEGEKPILMTGTATDISARKHAELELRRLSITDSLTGLYNRRYFFKRLTASVMGFKRHHRPFCVVMLDIDHFKKINDQYGHAAGDKVLCQVSTMMQELLRETDLLARLGGEEFVMLLVDTDLQGAKELAERIKANLAKLKVSYKEHSISVTISMGITNARINDINSDEVMFRADHAMYQAKSEGRNRIVISSIEDD